MAEDIEKPKKYFFEELLNFICNEKNEFYKDCNNNGVFSYLRASEKLYLEFKDILELEKNNITFGINKIDPISLISFIASSKKRSNDIKEKFFKNENVEITEKKDFKIISNFINYYNDNNKINAIIINLWLFAKELNGVVNTDLNYEETPDFEKAFRNIIPDEKINEVGIKNIKASNLSCIMALCKPNVYKAINMELLEDNKSNNKFNEIINNNRTIDELNNNCGYKMFNSIQSYLREKSLKEGSENQSMSTEPQTQPLNQILYGPPGTGKTYNTVVKAMQIMLTGLYEQINSKIKESKNELEQNNKSSIIEGILNNQNIFQYLNNEEKTNILNNLNNEQDIKINSKLICIQDDKNKVTLNDLLNNEKDNNIGKDKDKYNLLKAKFDELKKQGRIEFITFHQSYGYEDFIEGIKPDMDNESDDKIEYDIANGVFKKISKKALLERLIITPEKQNKILDFKYIINKFISNHQIGDKIKTSKSSFTIEKYTFYFFQLY